MVVVQHTREYFQLAEEISYFSLYHFLFALKALSVFVSQSLRYKWWEIKSKNSLMVSLPPAPAAWAATSGPASGRSPGVGPPHSCLLASSRDVASPPSALLASRVIVPALVRRQLTGQPQRGRYRLWRRRRCRLGGLCRRWGVGPHWNHRFQPRPLGCRLLRLASAGDALHRLRGGHSGGKRPLWWPLWWQTATLASNNRLYMVIDTKTWINTKWPRGLIVAVPRGTARIGQIALFPTQGPRAAYPHSYRCHFRIDNSWDSDIFFAFT